MLAIAHARSVPPVDENPINAIPLHDLALHGGHELEIVRPERAGDPHFGRGPVAPDFAVGIHGNPIGMGCLDVVVGGVRISAGNDDHSLLAAARYEFAEWISVCEPLAAMMKGNRRRVISDAAAGAQTGGVPFSATEIIEPELRIELSGIVLDKRQLGPPHWFIDPAGS